MGYIQKCIVWNQWSDSLPPGKKSKTNMGGGSGVWRWQNFGDIVIFWWRKWDLRMERWFYSLHSIWRVIFFHDYVFLICFSIVDVMDYIRLHRKIHHQEGSKESLSNPPVYDKKNFEVGYIENIGIKSSMSCNFLNSILLQKYTTGVLPRYECNLNLYDNSD